MTLSTLFESVEQMFSQQLESLGIFKIFILKFENQNNIFCRFL